MGLMTVSGNIIRIGDNSISVGPPDPEIYVAPSTICNVSYLGATCPVNVCGNKNNCTTVTSACSWLTVSSPITPSVPPGTVSNIQICENLTSSCRVGFVDYCPSLGGAIKTVTICQSTGDTNIYVTPSTISSVSGDGEFVNAYVCGPQSNTTTVSDACTWIIPSTPISPCASPGRLASIEVCCNTGVARSGLVCFVPTVGTTKCVCICQNACIPWKNVNFNTYVCYGSDGSNYSEKYSCMTYTPAMSAGDCYTLTFYYDLFVDAFDCDGFGNSGCASMDVLCNFGTICFITVDANTQSSYGQVSTIIRQGDSFCVMQCVISYCGGCYNYSYIYSLDATGIVGCYRAGTTCTSVNAYTGAPI